MKTLYSLLFLSLLGPSVLAQTRSVVRQPSSSDVQAEDIQAEDIQAEDVGELEFLDEEDLLPDEMLEEEPWAAPYQVAGSGMWVGVEYLLMWRSGQRVPPLAITDPNATEIPVMRSTELVV